MDIEFLSSPQNPKIKLIHELYEAKGRKKHQLFITEGFREIYIAVQSGYKPKYVFVNQEFLNKQDTHVFSVWSIAGNQIFQIDSAIFSKISYREDTEGIIAIFEWKNHTLKNLKLSANPLLIVVEAVEKPGNLGAILRTADAAQVDAVIVCNPVIDLYNPNVVRSSIGCIFSVPVALANTKETILWLKQHQVTTFAAALENAEFYHEQNYNIPSALVFGTEADGLSRQWLQESDKIIKIPMRGKIDSLNVSNAVAIMTFEAMRQRGFEK